jgi:hypothetical protein
MEEKRDEILALIRTTRASAQTSNAVG